MIAYWKIFRNLSTLLRNLTYLSLLNSFLFLSRFSVSLKSLNNYFFRWFAYKSLLSRFSVLISYIYGLLIIFPYPAVSHVFQGLGFSGSRFLGSRVQGPGPGYRSSPLLFTSSTFMIFSGTDSTSFATISSFSAVSSFSTVSTSVIIIIVISLFYVGTILANANKNQLTNIKIFIKQKNHFLHITHPQSIQFGCLGVNFSRSLRPSKTFLKVKYYVWWYEKIVSPKFLLLAHVYFRDQKNTDQQIQKNRFFPLYDYIFLR